MSISLAAAVPHHPLLLPNIAKDNITNLNSTVGALKKIGQYIKIRQIDTVIIFSAHDSPLSQIININHCPTFEAKFDQFGDLVTTFSLACDLELSYKLREALETKTFVSLTCNKRVSYGVAIPLFYMQKEHNFQIIPIYTSSQSLADHYQIAKSMNKILNLSSKRIAVIAAGDLSHTLSPNSPAGYSAKGKEFDNFLIKQLKHKNIEEIINLPEPFSQEAKECISKPLAMLLGVLADNKYSVEIMSYEHPFGIGHLVVNFNLI